MLRVLTLSTLYPDKDRPNFGRFVATQTRALANRPGVEVQVVVPIGLPPLAELMPAYRARARLPLHDVRDGLTVHRPRFRHWPGFSARDPAAMAKALIPMLTRLRASFPFDVIDAEFFWPDGPAAIRIGRHFDTPVSIKARGSDIHFWGRQPGIAEQIVQAGQAAQGLLAVSSALADDMAALGMARERIRVHYTGLDPARFAPCDRASAKARLKIEGPLIVCVGTLNANKGQALLIAALTQLPPAHLVLIGEGPDRDALMAQARTSGLGNRITFTGTLAPEQVARWLAAADVMALPSANEGLANAWVEALACGTPVVTCAVGGAPELIDRPAAGRLVARTPGALAAGLADVLAHPPDSMAVRATVDRFSWAANARTLHAHLDHLANPA